MSRLVTTRPRTTPRREMRDAALLLAALTATSFVSGPDLLTDGAGAWWLAAGIGIVYLRAGRGAHRTVVLAAAPPPALATQPGWSVTELPRTVAWSIAVATAYAAAERLSRRYLDDAGRTWGWRGPVVLNVGGPLLAAVSTAVVDLAMGVDLAGDPWVRIAAFTAAEATAVVVVVPLWVTFQVGAHRTLGERSRRPVAGLLTAAVTLAWLVASDGLLPVPSGLLMVVTTVPVVVAALAHPRSATTLTASATGVGVMVGLLTTAPGDDVRLVTLTAFLAVCALGFLVAGWTTTSTSATGRRAGTADAPSSSALEYRRRIARVLRGVRLGCAGSMALLIVADRAGWVTDPGSTGELARLTPIALLLLVNIASSRWDGRDDHSPGRQLIETSFDAIAVVDALVVYAGQLTYETVPLPLLLVAVAASLRLERRDALSVVGLAATALAAARLFAPAEWAVTPAGYEPLQALSLLVTPLLLTSLLTWGFAQLERQRAEAERTTTDLTAAHERERAQRAELTSSVERLERANAELTAVRSQLESFSSVVAHDLRSPIATARTFAVAMVDPKLPEEAREQFRERIVPNLDRAGRLIERLYAYAATSTSQVHAARVDLNRVVRGVLDDYSAALERFGVTVRQPQLLPQVECDAALIAQVFANLIGNAVRYASVDGHAPTIEITAAWQDDGVVVTIADDGPGIPAERAERLFAAGQRGADDGRGLGLGLATCRTAVQRHGGRIWAEPSRLGGAAISFLLPAPLTGPRRVLVVEDDADLRSMYVAMLGDREGLEVVTVDTVAGARSMLAERGPFALAVLDLGLPDGSGVQLLDALADAAVPVHVVSAATTSPDALQAVARGVPVTSKRDLVGAGRDVRALSGATLA